MANNKNLTRLRLRSDFLHLQSQGKRVHVNSWLLACHAKNKVNHLRVGWTLPSYVGSAVLRNRLKRWIRQYLAQNTEFKKNEGRDVNLVFKRIKKSEDYKNLKKRDIDEALSFLFTKKLNL